MNRNDAIAGVGAALLMGACCGGPLLVLVGAAIVSAIGVPALIVIIGASVLTAAAILWRRRACADCTAQPDERTAQFSKARSDRSSREAGGL